MRKSISIRAILATVLLIVAAAAHAQCVSIVRTVSQPFVFPNRGVGPIAWSGSRLGVVKTDAQSNAVTFSIYDGDLNQLTGDRQVVDSILGGPLALIWNGSEFALFYQTPLLQLVFQRLSTGGDPIGSPIAVAPQHLNWQNQEFDIAWDPTRNGYAIVHTIPTGFERGLWLTIVDREGRLLVDQQVSIFISSHSAPRIAVTKTGEIGMTWIRPDVVAETISFVLFSKLGNFSEVTTVSTTGSEARLATNDSYFLVITTAPTGGATELRTRRFDLKGSSLTGDTPFLAARGVDVAPLSLIWNPTLSEWALTYSDSVPGFTKFPGETRLRRFNFGGTASDTVFSPDPTKNIYTMQFPFVWSGTSYIGELSRTVSKSEGSDTLLVKHCPLQSSITAPPFVALFSFVPFSANVSGGTPDYRYQWDFGDFLKAEGATVQHQYTRTGTYTVTLTVTDTAGGTTVNTTIVTVVIPKHRTAKH